MPDSPTLALQWELLCTGLLRLATEGSLIVLSVLLAIELHERFSPRHRKK
jgi:hypothetical protein